MKMKNCKLLCVLFFPLLMSSCDEDLVLGCMDEFAVNYNAQAEEEGDCEYDAADVLQSQSWYIQSVTTDFAGSEVNLLELEELIPTCTHDNLFLFHEDNSLTMDDYLDLCEDGEESILDLTGIWLVEGDLLTIENGDEQYLLTIANLTSNSMDLLFDYYWADFDVTVPAKIILLSN